MAESNQSFIFLSEMMTSAKMNEIAITMNESSQGFSRHQNPLATLMVEVITILFKLETSKK
jgi:hypothetical protein